jgi:predicted RNA-binding Zn-ribbon protein involved in translation (DUF1610 family)
MLTFDARPGKADQPDIQFTCPGCGARRIIPSSAGARVAAESVRVRRI